MKRRAFIGLIGASALSTPFILSQAGLGPARRTNRIAASKKIPLRIKLPKDVSRVCARLGEASRKVYITGGVTLAAASGVQTPYLNLLVNTSKFTELKNGLFEFGVTPISTPELPANFARFLYQDRAYNLVNMSFDSYCQLSLAGQQNGLIQFAHNFLVYNVTDCTLSDPYDALSEKTPQGKSFLIRPIEQPRSLLHGFDHCLAAMFDCALLGLKPSAEFKAIEQRVFNSMPSEEDSKEIMSRTLDYMADIIEVCGMEGASRLMLSPVCLEASKTMAQVDLAKIESGLRSAAKQGAEVTGAMFMKLFNDELKAKKSGKGSALGLAEYFSVEKKPVRRLETLMDAMEPAAT